MPKPLKGEPLGKNPEPRFNSSRSYKKRDSKKLSRFFGAAGRASQREVLSSITFVMLRLKLRLLLIPKNLFILKIFLGALNIIFNSSRSYKKRDSKKLSRFFGAAGRNRTDTVSLPRDFESRASASFTTAAFLKIVLIFNRICGILNR